MWYGIEQVMYNFQYIILNLPSEIFTVLKVSWFLFITLGAVKVLSFKEG